MAKILMVRSSCSNHYLTTVSLLPPQKAMAMCSSLLPIQFRPKPISYLPNKPQFYVQVKAFSSQESNSPTKDEVPTRVGFLGLGIMGSPMAQNLIKAGCDVTVWNRTKSKCDPLISLGAKYKPSPEEVAASCDVTFAMLADPESAVDVACGKQGAASGMSSGKGKNPTNLYLKYMQICLAFGPLENFLSLNSLQNLGAAINWRFYAH